MSWKDFRIFLALQQLGRGYVTENVENDHTQTRYSLTRQSLSASRKIIRAVLTQLDYDEKKIALFESLLKYDVLNPYLNDVISQYEAVALIQEMARRSGGDEEHIARALTAIHVASTFEEQHNQSTLFAKDEVIPPAPSQGWITTIVNVLVWPFALIPRFAFWVVGLFTGAKPEFDYRLF